MGLQIHYFVDHGFVEKENVSASNIFQQNHPLNTQYHQLDQYFADKNGISTEKQKVVPLKVHLMNKGYHEIMLHNILKRTFMYAFSFSPYLRELDLVGPEAPIKLDMLRMHTHLLYSIFYCSVQRFGDAIIIILCSDFNFPTFCIVYSTVLLNVLEMLL